MPEELAGMTLESRLISYDWKNQFDSFQKVTQSGTFKTICWDAKNIPIPVSHFLIIIVYFFLHNFNIVKYVYFFLQ